jgi:hypothetical protein
MCVVVQFVNDCNFFLSLANILDITTIHEDPLFVPSSLALSQDPSP